MSKKHVLIMTLSNFLWMTRYRGSKLVVFWGFVALLVSEAVFSKGPI